MKNRKNNGQFFKGKSGYTALSSIEGSNPSLSTVLSSKTSCKTGFFGL